jgi:hypothetical protein
MAEIKEWFFMVNVLIEKDKGWLNRGWFIPSRRKKKWV